MQAVFEIAKAAAEGRPQAHEQLLIVLRQKETREVLCCITFNRYSFQMRFDVHIFIPLRRLVSISHMILVYYSSPTLIIDLDSPTSQPQSRNQNQNEGTIITKAGQTRQPR